MARTITAAVAAAALATAPAQAGCWQSEEASAATVRTLQSMLMVAALRCEASGHSIMVDYNAFVLANKQVIGAQNERLKAHFVHAMGPGTGQRAYDSFTTSLANGYGAGARGIDSCNDAAALAREAAMMAGSLEGLLVVADRQGLAPIVATDICPTAPAVVLAANEPVPAPVAPALLADAGTPPDEAVPGDESTPAAPVGKVDPAGAFAPAAAPVAVAEAAPAEVAPAAAVPIARAQAVAAIPAAAPVPASPLPSAPVELAAAEPAPARAAPAYRAAPVPPAAYAASSGYQPGPAYQEPAYQPQPAYQQPAYQPQPAYQSSPRSYPAPRYAEAYPGYAPAPYAQPAPPRWAPPQGYAQAYAPPQQNYAYPPQQAYPSQAYPPQQPYPPQAYAPAPQQPYAYPQQAYAYPPQGYGYAAPPAWGYQR